ncbi:MAG: M28 family peptidase, partial [Muribaculaceae bacterium]|nr:M28 family peptidase [Muribaculaceae bacterium]
KALARNVMGRFNPQARKRVLLLAHYASRTWADQAPDPANHTKAIDGANDGASGAAVLLELARLLGQQRPDSLGVDLLFVDAEDSGNSDSYDSDLTWCLGTQAWVRQMPYTRAEMPRYAILLDMVGGRGARFHREYFSDRFARPVVDKIWAAAARAGHADRFPNAPGGSVVDDHIHINRAGIPCVDIIETQNPETGSFNPTWHTMADNLSNIDRETLRIVAQVVADVLYNE